MKQNVLVVDDDPSVRYAVQAVLQRYEIQVTTADSGTRCLDHLHEGFRGLVLMDVMMPELDGFETISRALQNGLAEGNVFCMLTAVQDPWTEMEPVKEVILDYVRKPFDSHALVAVVQDYLSYC